MSTVSTLLSNLGNSLNDPNESTFTEALKLTAMNNGQNELVLRLLAFGEKYQGVFDLLGEVMESESVSVGTTGYALSGLSNRYFMTNGYVLSRITVDGEYEYPTRLSADRIGITQNYYFAGIDEDPIIYFQGGKLFILVSIGSYPVSVQFTYIGEPYTLATSASGSGPSQSVATPDLNPLMHDLITKIAQRDLLRYRGDATDFKEAQEIERQVTLEIQSLAMGEKASPKSSTLGQHEREEEQEVS
jgi:hypothetical protein